MRSARNAAASYLSLSIEAEANDFTVGAVDVSSETSQASSFLRVVIALGLLFLLFGFRAPETFLDRALHWSRDVAEALFAISDRLARSLRGRLVEGTSGGIR
ncbi:MAG: hypothetical protein ACREQY_10490, partial [Candidatus Binatia bacterium]